MLNSPDAAPPFKIDPGGYRVSRNSQHVLVTVLGSCVSACLHDPRAGIGGMNHFMLPGSGSGEWGGISDSMRFGTFAMEQLINDILAGGGRRPSLQAKLFGGASMVANSTIGRRNADFVEAYLRQEGIRVVAADLRGPHTRSVRFEPATGRAFMRLLPREHGAVACRERTYAARLETQPIAGEVELFS